MPEFILELKSIDKAFPGVKALDNVGFQLKKGEIHALMGENGAGKSTFIKIITGVHEPDAGEIILDGSPVRFRTPKDAQKQAIAAIYQHGAIYPWLSVTENIFMGHEEVAGPLKTIKWKAMHSKAEELLRGLGSDLDPRIEVSGLTVAEQQVVEIAKAISQNARILVMDEPTASLSRRECDELYRIAEKLRDDGVSIIFISHRMEDMQRLASRVTVFRDGKLIGTWGVGDISNHDLISAMVGREINQIYPARNRAIGEEVFRAQGLSRKGFFKDISFKLHKGEILGFSGLVGAGRTDVMQSIFGVEPLDSGKMFLEGKEVQVRKPLDAMKLGIGLLPEDRHKQGLVLDWEIFKNITLSDLGQFAKYSVMKPKKERAKAKALGELLALKAPTVFDKASSMSGGNQQKIVICKLLNTDLKVLILDEPTKGVDVGVKSQLYEIISDLAGQGYGVILISSDMPEILGMCDRIATMREGRITGEFIGSEATQEQLLQASMSQAGGAYEKVLN
ncbi:MAG: sugar ABC transporter ATP-binding protein [Clostridiales bacterium]|jgi:rhamnose transport system ATP-binding protein|nr:sugar ABC transporter ATP-binding protein [Clostridiales bacterium]